MKEFWRQDELSAEQIIKKTRVKFTKEDDVCSNELTYNQSSSN